ncbi:MAG: hypothetical protein WD757_00765 [Actinomycetota bacterium]
MSKRARRLAGLTVVAIFGAVVIFRVLSLRDPGAVPAEVQPRTSSPSPNVTLELEGRGSAQEALLQLCPSGGRAKDQQPPVRSSSEVPPAIAETQDQVEQVRELEFLRPVEADPLSREALTEKLRNFAEQELPRGPLRRRGLAWETIGAIPEGTNLRDAHLDLLGSQVVGFYIPETEELFFLGSNDPSPLERYILAHELTHALDDQHFDLDRIDALSGKCQDDAVAAATAVVEGSAEASTVLVVQRFFSVSDQLELGSEAVATSQSTGDAPPFLVELAIWPYIEGLEFVSELQSRDGFEGVNAALRSPPVTSEQVLHPEKYPSDEPQETDIPDLGPRLGGNWSDIDVQDVGEQWLSTLLDLRLPPDEAEAAAAGWDGGIYRAWSDGEKVAVVLTTAWDSSGDAAEFAEAMREWFEPGQAAVASSHGDRALVFFASDQPTLDALIRAGSVN